ncbi:hypothetical protein KAR91_15250 [Candidatus Pacearchaeota archaeon]|nr:hypothetical protein [Candidatus Pacearchaeota archaeon]
MKALTIRPPWPNLIQLGLKDIEIRSKKINYKGEIALYVGKNVDFHALFYFKTRSEWKHTEHFKNLNKGLIIATFRIKEIIEFTDQEMFRQFQYRHRIPYEFDPIKHKNGMVITDLKLLEHPIPWRGMLGLFECPIMDHPRENIGYTP